MTSKMLPLALPALLCIACNQSTTPGPLENISWVTFLDRGAVVPDPTRTLVVVSQDSISLVTYRTADTMAVWSASLANGDFAHVVSIIQDNNLIGMSDPTLPAGMTGCVGHQGMSIVFKVTSRLDTLNISGLLWCTELRAYWPPGLLSLVTYETDLVDKYAP
jgi:hypothetical protein